jgi:hypothetical protein
VGLEGVREAHDSGADHDEVGRKSGGTGGHDADCTGAPSESETCDSTCLNKFIWGLPAM